MKSTESDFFPINGASIHCRTAGTGPVLVLLHAGIADGRMWQGQLDAFSDSFTVIAPDMRGFGRSALPNAPFAHHRDLLALLDALEVRAATLVGASQGGAAALNVALERPERIKALVLVDAAVHGYRDWSDEVRAFGAAEDDALERGDVETATELNVRMWVDRPGRTGVSAAVCDQVRAMQRRAFELQLAALEAIETSLEPRVIDRLAEVGAPALVLVGEEDVPDFAQIARRLATEMPRARLDTVPGAAHLPSLEQPERFNRALRAFLAELEQ